jgi:glycosyltransferase involved in cell wall biosynthesis
LRPDPKISTIITCYNQTKDIAEAIGSVSKQTFSEWECIVVDDGSTDDGAKVIGEFVRSDERIKYYFQKNAGVASARNAGFRRARGEFIQFLDGDDLIDPQKFEIQVDHFRADKTIDVSCVGHRHYYKSKGLFEIYHSEPIEAYPLRQLLQDWQGRLSFPPHAPMFRRSIWSEGGLPYPEDYKERCEDWIFLVLVAAKNVKFAQLDKVLCTYVIHDMNFTADVRNSCVAAIRAAQYLEENIPATFRDGFVAGVIERSLERYLEAKKPEILQASRNWQLGNWMTQPFFKLGRGIKSSLSTK